MTKITKRDNYNSLRELVTLALDKDYVEAAEANRLCAFIDHEIELMDKRSEKAKTYAKAKSAKAADELADAALVALRSMEDEATIADIVAAVNAEAPELNATSGKLAYRLNKLVEAGLAIKTEITIKEEGKSRKVNGYKAVVEEVEAE